MKPGFAQALRQLDLPRDKRTRIKEMLAEYRAQQRVIRWSLRMNREAMDRLAPSDAAYAAHVAAAKSDAAARIQAEFEFREAVCALLTPAQVAVIPSIVAAERAMRSARFAAWRAEYERF